MMENVLEVQPKKKKKVKSLDGYFRSQKMRKK